jgi:hypothetical protein
MGLRVTRSRRNAAITGIACNCKYISDFIITVIIDYCCDMKPESRNSEVRIYVHC